MTYEKTFMSDFIKIKTSILQDTVKRMKRKAPALDKYLVNTNLIKDFYPNVQRTQTKQ